MHIRFAYLIRVFFTKLTNHMLGYFLYKDLRSGKFLKGKQVGNLIKNKYKKMYL